MALPTENPVRSFEGTSVPAPRPAENVVARRLDDAGVLVDLRTNSIFELNETGMRTWELLRGSKTVGDILAQLRLEFAADAAEIEADVLALLSELRSQGLIEQ